MDGQLVAQRNTHDLLSDVFARSVARASAHTYIEALIGDSTRKTSWPMSEAAGFQNPYRFQHLLGRAVWDVERLRSHIADRVCDGLGSSNVILSVDETGFLKKRAGIRQVLADSTVEPLAELKIVKSESSSIIQQTEVMLYSTEHSTCQRSGPTTPRG